MSKLSDPQCPDFLYDVQHATLLDTRLPQPAAVLTGKPGEILGVLMGSPNKVVSVSDIKQIVWGNTIVTDHSVKDCIARIHAALNDSAAPPVFIETLRGRGYRYLGGIATSRGQPSATKVQPTLAIIPPVSRCRPEQGCQMIGETVAANILDSVSGSPLINITAHLNMRQFTDRNNDMSKPGKSPEADYLLSGMYYSQDESLVLFIELSHASNSTTVWADNFRGTAANWHNRDDEQLQQMTQLVLDKIFLHKMTDYTNDGLYQSRLNH